MLKNEWITRRLDLDLPFGIADGKIANNFRTRVQSLESFVME